MQQKRTGGRAARRNGWAFRAFMLAALVVAAIPAVDIQAKAAGHRHSTNNQYLIPPPPPTPVLTPPPAPVELPYSYAYANFQASATAPAKHQAVMPSAPAPTRMTTTGGSNLNVAFAKARGFGNPRAMCTTAPGGAQAMPFVVPHTGNPWFDACLNWYTGHNAAQQAGYGSIQPVGYLGGSFYPVYPQSLEQQQPMPLMTAASVETPSAPVSGVEPRFAQPVHHTDFRHRKHVVAKR